MLSYRYTRLFRSLVTTNNLYFQHTVYLKTTFKMTHRSTVGLVIIGDEILNGKVTDRNSQFLCHNFYEMGIRVGEIGHVPDNTDDISACVSRFKNRFSFVLTTGGIGPTHDDLTYEGVAKSFGEKLIENAQLAKVYREWCQQFGFSLESVEKMSKVPVSSKVHLMRGILADVTVYPVVSVENVFILPGIPLYLERLFDALKPVFNASLVKKFCTRCVYLNTSEFNIVTILNTVSDRYKTEVVFGSYPVTDRDLPYQVYVTMEADNYGILEDAEAFLRGVLPSNAILGPLDPKSDESILRLFEFARGELKFDYLEIGDAEVVVSESIASLEECLSRFSPENIALSFNGGKDCTALLHLAYSVIKKKHPTFEKLKTVYIKPAMAFSEVDDFLDATAKRYNLELYTYDGPIKKGLSELITDHPEIKAVLMGTRQTDPFSSKLKVFQPTDEGWPSLLRVCPLLDWTYQNIWTFLRSLDIAYCSLYDQGYTSLGCRSNTKPNESLLVENTQRYRPAYLLSDPLKERNGRC